MKIRTFSSIKFIKHYLRPLTVRGRRRPYDPKVFFDSWYGSVAHKDFSDGITISPRHNPLFTQYHYNSVENSIIRLLASRSIKEHPVLLDVGSGAGHWVDFYLKVFGASSVTAIEISKLCVEALKRKFSGSGVEVRMIDISAPDCDLRQSYDIINAIGVMFHLVDDDRWRQALANVAGLLKEDGVFVCGGQFGFITQNIQFHENDNFTDFCDVRDPSGDTVLVNKRIRSYRQWKKCAGRAGLEILGLEKSDQHQGITVPENNVMLLGRR